MADSLDDLNDKFDAALDKAPVPDAVKKYVNEVQDAAFAKYKAQSLLARAAIVFLVAFASVLVGHYVWKDPKPAPIVLPFEQQVAPGTEPVLTVRERIVVRQLRAAAEAKAKDAGYADVGGPQAVTEARVAADSAKVTDYQIVLALKASGQYQPLVDAAADRPVLAFFLSVVRFIAEHPELLKLILLLFMM